MTCYKWLILCIVYGQVINASLTAWKGDVAYKQGNFAQAKSLYEDVVTKNPEDMQALYNVGKASYKLKEYQTAVKAFDKAAHSTTNSLLKEQAFFNLGDAQVSAKNLAEALCSYEEVLKLNKNNTHAKERIELVKKLMEQQKEQEKQNQQDKQDDKEKQESKEQDQQKDKQSQSDKQDGSGEKDTQEQDGSDKQDSQKKEESADKEGHDEQSRDQKTGADQSTQKAEDKQKGQQDKPKNGTDQPKNDKEAEQKDRGDRHGKSDVDDAKETEQSQAQKDEAHKEAPSKSELDKKEGNSKELLTKSVAEKQLNAQEQAFLEMVEERDKEVYKAFIKSRMPEKAEQDGYKNW